MKTLFTLLLISICSMAFGQNKFKKQFKDADNSITALSSGITVTDEVRLNQLGLDRKVELSKGEALQQNDWEEFLKQFQREEKIRQKYFHQRDSTHQVFLRYTVSPYLNPGDTVVEFNESPKEFTWKLKPKKK